MTIANVGLVGSTRFFQTTLVDILKESDFDVDLHETDSINIKDTSIRKKYDLVIISKDLAIGVEEELFDFLLSTKGFLLVDETDELIKPSVEPPFYINNLMGPEEIISRVNNVIYGKAGKGGRSTRRSPRVKVNILVEYRFEGKRYTSKIKNLSVYGAFISSLNPPPKDSLIEMSFKIPNTEERIETTGRILYRIGFNLNRGIISHPISTDKKIIALPGIGISFEKISKKDRETLKSFIGKLCV